MKMRMKQLILWSDFCKCLLRFLRYEFYSKFLLPYRLHCQDHRHLKLKYIIDNAYQILVHFTKVKIKSV